jgi:hypothetical protein
MAGGRSRGNYGIPILHRSRSDGLISSLNATIGTVVHGDRMDGTRLDSEEMPDAAVDLRGRAARVRHSLVDKRMGTLFLTEYEV